MSIDSVQSMQTSISCVFLQPMTATVDSQAVNVGSRPVDGQMNHVFGMYNWSEPYLPHAVSRKGKDSVAEDAVLSFDGDFQESFFG